MVDRETLLRRLGLLQDALADLRRYRRQFDAAALRTNRDAQHMVCHALYVAAQAAIDIGLHAAADAEQPGAETYQQAFARLADAGRLTPELARRMQGWAGLRNVLAHHYATIDYERIATAMTSELDDLEQFVVAAAGWL
ncbi:MAG: DUF86 domain-containing protein [Planctomycetota bacterium]